MHLVLTFTFFIMVLALTVIIGHVLFNTLGLIPTIILAAYVTYVMYHIYGDDPFNKK